MYVGYVCNYSVVQKYRDNDTYITFIKSKEQMKICFHAKNRLGLTSKIFSKYFCFKNDKKVRIVILTNITGLFNWNLDTLVKINFIYISLTKTRQAMQFYKEWKYFGTREIITPFSLLKLIHCTTFKM